MLGMVCETAIERKCPPHLDSKSIPTPTDWTAAKASSSPRVRSAPWLWMAVTESCFRLCGLSGWALPRLQGCQEAAVILILQRRVPAAPCDTFPWTRGHSWRSSGEYCSCVTHCRWQNAENLTESSGGFITPKTGCSLLTQKTLYYIII